MDRSSQKISVIMSGGGARAAYQVGVLKAVARILPANIPNPFQIICGASAGAINAASLAVYANNFQQAVRRMEHVWGNFHVHQVFRVDARGMAGNLVALLSSLFFAGIYLGLRRERDNGAEAAVCWGNVLAAAALAQLVRPVERELADIRGVDLGHRAVALLAPIHPVGQPLRAFSCLL